ncbi:hypothetical protein Glove_480g13 [Diversispora epigaea]|uniref:Uncharacterized protein n=1 Tax=Diversispora epigaea TaxID=1348612 RepID=A0A397GKD6_9GLOM|nr:hypothetical protein Glove_480g13 [Diversispora epigaea]
MSPAHQFEEKTFTKFTYYRAVIFNSDNSNNDDYNKNILQHSNSFDSILTNSSKMSIQSFSTLSNDKKSITFRAARPVSPISFDAKTIQDLLVFINLNVNHLKINRAVIFNSDNSNNDDYNKNILQHSNSFDSILTNSSKMSIQSFSTLSNDKKSITFRAARPVSPISFDAKTIQDLLVFINLNVNHLKISITKYVLQL